jgi:predicted AAA+ superfamily ATPase
LTASYQVYLLSPFHANLSKRLVKAPKIYFGDTALASYLMGIHDPEVLMEGPFLGPLFETAVFLEHLKWGSFRGDLPPMSYFRTKDGLEVDLLIEDGGRLIAREIKTKRTLDTQMGETVIKAEKLLKRPLNKIILAPVEKRISLGQGIDVCPWHDVEW